MDYKFKFDTAVENTWCPGCGNFGIQDSLKQALYELNLDPKDVLVVSGIGQAAKMPHYINSNGFNGLHGRALPAALGAHIANPSLKIIVSSGDGDSYGEGGNHFLHNIRRNIDIVHMVHNNQIYGLTKGQGSPTTDPGQKTSLQTDGVILDPINPIALAISLNCSFVARAFSGDAQQLKDILKQAMEHKGYSYIDILQPCISFNKVNTYKWYKERAFYLDESYDPFDRVKAFETSLKWGDGGIALGVIYKNPKLPYLERLSVKPSEVTSDPISSIKDFLNDL